MRPSHEYLVISQRLLQSFVEVPGNAVVKTPVSPEGYLVVWCGLPSFLLYCLR